MINLINIIIFSLIIISINGLSTPYKAYKSNNLAIFSILFAILLSLKNLSPFFLLLSISAIILGSIIGIVSAHKISLPKLPQMIAIFNGFGGLCAGLIGITETNISHSYQLLKIFIIITGFTTFSSSITAFLKLNNAFTNTDKNFLQTICSIFFILTIISSFYAYNGELKHIIVLSILTTIWASTFTLPIGNADMPIIISALNSLSGWCTTLVGFSQNNTMLLVIGALIGSSGTILTYIITKAMNRNIIKVIFSPITTPQKTTQKDKHVNIGSPLDAAFLMENASKVIIIPGYGMAASGAQHDLATMAEILKTKYNVNVKFAIHPVAGRMPGHMNILLAEADINPNDIYELKDINPEFKTTDVVYIIGANDITNPTAKTQVDSPIYKMPILEAEYAKKILFVKRSLSPGYSGIDNPLFYAENTIMLLGDAKEITKKIISELE